MGDKLFIPGLRTGLGDLPSKSMPQDYRGEDFKGGVAGRGTAFSPQQAAAQEPAGDGFVRPSEGESSTGAGETVMIDRSQMPDLDTFTFDRMGFPIGAINNIPAGVVNFPLVSIPFPNRVRGVIKRFGWYATAGGAATDLFFGLYINNELYLPGGRYVSDQARTVSDYDPSGGSIDFPNLCGCNVSIPQGASAQILVTNANALASYQAWGRLWGDHWSDDTIQIAGSAKAMRRRGRMKAR